MTADPKAVVERFWQVMNSNDFRAASALLAEAYLLHYPQSGEHFRGRDAFVAVNSDYPAHGPWRFELRKLLAEGSEVVSEVMVSDGVVNARALTFSTVADGLILRETQFWPEAYEAPLWRRGLVETLDS